LKIRSNESGIDMLVIYNIIGCDSSEKERSPWT
jgi:hypothetical protein